MNAIQSVYAYLKGAMEPRGVARIAADLSIPYQTAQSAIQRLKHTGVVFKLGKGSHGIHVVWECTGKAWDFPERRGKSPGSRRALKQYGGGFCGKTSAKSLENLRNVKVVSGKVHPRPVAKHALDKAWGWSPSRTVDKSMASCVNDGGAVRPENL